MVTDAAGRDRGHRLVEHAHAFRNATADHVGLAKEGARLDLEVDIAETTCDRQRGHGQPLALGRVTRERCVQKRQPAVRRTLLDAIEHARCALLPPKADAEVAVVRDVHERQPDRVVRRGCELSAAHVQLKRPLLELDRALVLAVDHGDLAQPGQRLRALLLLEHPLETDARPLPVGDGNRLLAVMQQVFLRMALHRPRSSQSGRSNTSAAQQSQDSPRQAATPSLAASPAMRRAITGSSHHQPTTVLASKPASTPAAM